MSNQEIWKDIVGYEGLYQVSNLGNVKSFNKNKLMKIGFHQDGYNRLWLSKENKSKGFLLHRLIAIHFIPNPNNLPEVNHKDANKLNNSIGNLEWCSHSENMAHANAMGLISTTEMIKTLKKYNSVDRDRATELINSGKSFREVERITGISAKTIKTMVEKPELYE
jgi:uncharacterized protein YerC